MKIHIVSDLHLECASYPQRTIGCDVVVLAGDINNKGIKSIEWARSHYWDKEIIFVPGNHEYYGDEFNSLNERMQEAGRKHNVHVLNRGEVILGGVRFLGCTLWTDFRLHGEDERAWAMRECSSYLADFRDVRYGNRLLLPDDTINFHIWDTGFLVQKIWSEPFAGKTVVVTHHLPSMLSVADRYKTELASAGFASKLDYLLDGEQVALWLHGHTHDNFDYVSNGTRVVCNPRGYERYNGGENSSFNPTFTVEI